MNFNIAKGQPAFIAWDGTTSYERSLVGFTDFGFTFEVTEDLTQQAMFVIEAASASVTDPDKPGEFLAIGIVNTCPTGSSDNDPTTIVIPSGTKKGEYITSTLPCKPDKFIKLRSVVGDTSKVKAVISLKGKGV